MAVARVNVTAISDWSGTPSLTYAASALSITAGNLIVVAVGGFATSGQTVAGLADTAGNTYTRVDGVQEAGDGYRTEIRYAKNALGHAADVVTVTWSASTPYRGIVVVQYTGLDTVAPLDGSAKGTSTSGLTVTTGSFSTTEDNDVHVLVGRFGPAGGVPPAPAGFTSVSADTNAFFYEQFLPALFTGTRSLTYNSPSSARTLLTVAFLSTAPPPAAASGRVSQEVIELLGTSTATALPTTARVTQDAVEVLTFIPPPPPTVARVTQDAVEVLTKSPPVGTRTTQLPLETYQGQAARARTTQVAVELFRPLHAPARLTQLPVEALVGGAARTRLTQEAVEVFLVDRPRRPIRRLRRAPHVHDEHRRIAYARFALDLQRGVGRLAGQGASPVVTLRVSRDGGQTWSEPVTMRAGALGAFTTRVLARRLGHARDAVFEVTVSDPVAWSLVQAWLDLEPGTS